MRKSVFVLIITLLVVFACQADLLSDRIADLGREVDSFSAALEQAKLEMRDLDYNTLNAHVEALRLDLEKCTDLYAANQEDELYLLLGSITATLKDLQPMLYESLPVETRAMWVDRAMVESFFNINDIRRHLDQMQSINVNLIFIDVYNNGTSVYPSKVATQLRKIQLMYEGDDLLKDYITEAHQRGIEVHPMVRVFGIHNGAEYFIDSRAHWLDRTKDNNYTLANGFFWLNPVHPEVREYMINLLKELTENYDVDGIHLDYIRYDTDYGYSPYTRELFKSLFGVDPFDINTEEMEKTFTVFKTQFINKFVERAYFELKAIKPNLIVSAAVGSPYTWLKLEKAQDWVNWAENRIVHFVTPMSYRATAKEYLSVVNADITATEGKTYLYPGLGIYLVSDGISVVEQLIAAQGTSVSGQAIFSSTSVRASQYKALQDGPWKYPALPTCRDPQMAATVLLEYLSLRLEKFQESIGLDPALVGEYLQLINDVSGRIENAELRKWDTRDLRTPSEVEAQILEELISEISSLKRRVSRDSASGKLPKATADRIMRDLNQVEDLLKPLYYTSLPFVYHPTSIL